MTDFILIVILLGIAAAIVFYLHKEKKRGVACVGCPHAKQCAKKHGRQGANQNADHHRYVGACSCDSNEETE